ncbi:hypothetical protein KFL_004180110 [Klebsormidium nitens]|uniref:Uncharacterized protein n=1 Tax=Klebsormidium nitens TaxID=105231 RepID=A0A1Y1IHY2_KLENI|nr:hypothetical protein KFL_004180110 [Klebsormidium nitens]|eukprot:GAQ88326.1 hypothetical protein KFL_004180110 [Klebsormidium nitens]
MAGQAGRSTNTPLKGGKERGAESGGGAGAAAQGGRTETERRGVEGVERLGRISTTGELLKTLASSLTAPPTVPVANKSQNDPNAPPAKHSVQSLLKQPAPLKVPKAENLDEPVDVKPIIKGTAARVSPEMPASPTGSASNKPLQRGDSRAKATPPVPPPAAPREAPGSSTGGAKGNTAYHRAVPVPHPAPPVNPHPSSHNPPRVSPFAPPLPDGPPPAASRPQAQWLDRHFDTSRPPAHHWQGHWMVNDSRRADYRQPPVSSARGMEPSFVPPPPQHPPPPERAIPHPERLAPQHPGAAGKPPPQGSPNSWPRPLHPGGIPTHPVKDPSPRGETARSGWGVARDPRERPPEQGRRADPSAQTLPGAARLGDVSKQRRADVTALIPLGRRHAQAPGASRVADVSRDGGKPNVTGGERKQLAGEPKNPPVPSSSSAAGGSAKRDKKLVWGGGIWSGGEMKARVEARALGKGGERIWTLPAERIDLTGTVPVDRDLKAKAVDDIEDPILLLTSAKQSAGPDGASTPPFAGLGNSLAPGTASIADIPACTDEDGQTRNASLYIMSYTTLKTLLGKGLRARGIDFDETLAESALFGVVMLGDGISAGDKRTAGNSSSEPKAEVGEGGTMAGTGTEILSPAQEVQATRDGRKAEVSPQGQLDRPESAGAELAEPGNEAVLSNPPGASGLVDDANQPAAGRNAFVAELTDAPRLLLTETLPELSDRKAPARGSGLVGPRADDPSSGLGPGMDGPGAATWQPKEAPDGEKGAHLEKEADRPPGFEKSVEGSQGVSGVASGGPESRQSNGGDPVEQASAPMDLETEGGSAEETSKVSDVSKENVCGERVLEGAKEKSVSKGIRERSKDTDEKPAPAEKGEEKGGPVGEGADGSRQPKEEAADGNEARIQALLVRQQERERQDRRDRNRAEQVERKKARAEASREGARALTGEPELERGRERRDRSRERGASREERRAERGRERRSDRSPERAPKRALEKGFQGGSGEKRTERAAGIRPDRSSERNKRSLSPAREISRKEERARARFEADWAAEKRSFDPRLRNLWVTGPNPALFGDARFRHGFVRDLIEQMGGPRARRLGLKGGLKVVDNPIKVKRSLLLRLESMEQVARVLYMADQDQALVPGHCRLGCEDLYRPLYREKLEWMRKDRDNGHRHRSPSESRRGARANSRERSLGRKERSIDRKGEKHDTPRGKDRSGRSFSGDRERAPGQETPRAEAKEKDGASERELKDREVAAKGETRDREMAVRQEKSPTEEGGWVETVEPGCLRLSPDSTAPAEVQRGTDVELASVDGVSSVKGELGEGVTEADGYGEGVRKGTESGGGGFCKTERVAEGGVKEGVWLGELGVTFASDVNEGVGLGAGGVNKACGPAEDEVTAPAKEEPLKGETLGREAGPTGTKLDVGEAESEAVKEKSFESEAIKEESAVKRFDLNDLPEPKKRPFLFDLNEPPPVEIEDEDEPLDAPENGLAGGLAATPPEQVTPSNAREPMEGPAEDMELAPEEQSADWAEDEGPDLPPGFEGVYLEQCGWSPIRVEREERGSVDRDCEAVVEELQGLPRSEGDVSTDGDVGEHASREEVLRARRARWDAIKKRVDAEEAGKKTETEPEGARGGGTEEDADAARLEWLLREAKELAHRIKLKEQRGQKAGSKGAESRNLSAQGVGGTPGASGEGGSVPGETKAEERNVSPDPEPEAGDAKAALGKIQEQLQQFGIQLGPRERTPAEHRESENKQAGGKEQTSARIDQEDRGSLGGGKGGGALWMLSAVRTSETLKKDESEMKKSDESKSSKAEVRPNGKEPEKVKGFWEDGEEGGLLPAKARPLGRKTKISSERWRVCWGRRGSLALRNRGRGLGVRHQRKREWRKWEQYQRTKRGKATRGVRIRSCFQRAWSTSVAVAVPPVVGRAFMKVKEGMRQIAMWELDTALQERFYGRVRVIEASAHVTLTSAEAKDGRKGFLYEASSAEQRDNARPLVHALLVDVSADIMKRREEVEKPANQPPPATCPQQTAPQTDPVQVLPPLHWDGERWVVHFGEGPYEPGAYGTVPGAYEAAPGQIPSYDSDALQALAAYGQDSAGQGRGLGPYEWGPAPYGLDPASSDGVALQRWTSVDGWEGYVNPGIEAAGQANHPVSSGLPELSPARKPVVQLNPTEPEEDVWCAPGVFASRLYCAGAHFEKLREEVLELNSPEPLPPGVLSVPEQAPRENKSPLPPSTMKSSVPETASTDDAKRSWGSIPPVSEPQPAVAINTTGDEAEGSKWELKPPGGDAERAALCAMSNWLSGSFETDADVLIRKNSPSCGAANRDVAGEGGSGSGIHPDFGPRSGSGLPSGPGLHPGPAMPASASLQNGEPAKTPSLLQGALTVPSSRTVDDFETGQSGAGGQCQSVAATDRGSEMTPRNGLAVPTSALGGDEAKVAGGSGSGESTRKGLPECTNWPDSAERAGPNASVNMGRRPAGEEDEGTDGDVSTDSAQTAPECFSETTTQATSLVASGSTEILDSDWGAQDEATSKVKGPLE